MKQFLPLAVSLVLAYSAALLGSLFTAGAIDTWYATLAKPELNPPSWLFGPVWTALYTLMAIAAWRVYKKKKTSRTVPKVLYVYLFHLAVNAFWSIAFFGLQNPMLALVVIVVLWALIVYLVTRFFRIDRLAGYLLLPYLAWVSFATYLNLMIALLN